MLYFKAFLEGLADMPPAQQQIRAGIEALAAARGWPAVHAELARVDPEAARRIHPHHSQRLSRALEVYRASGIPLSEWQEKGGAWLPRQDYRIRQLAICPADRAELHRRIERRFRQMMAAGLLQEVQRLRSRGDLHPDLPALRAVGYRQLWQHLDGRFDLDEAVTRAIAATRQLAKRQLTWLRKWPELEWIFTDHAGNGYETREDALAAEHAGSAQGGENIIKIALKYLERAPISPG
jgi:tRNA dimethylallyltransferase